MVKHEISVHPRSVVGRKVKDLRKKGITPGNVFGKKIKSLSIQFDTKELLKLFTLAGESTLVYLKVEGEKESRPVFITDMVKDSVSGVLLHVTFHQVDLKEKVTAPVPIKLVGLALAEKEKLGILVQQLDELEVEALPTDMPEHIEVDISSLSEVGAHITVAALKLDTSKLQVKTDPATIIVQIEQLAKEEVEPVVAAPAVGPETASETPAAEALAPAEPKAKAEK